MQKMKRIILLSSLLVALALRVSAQYIYPVNEYYDEERNILLNNFDIQDTVLFLPLGEAGMHVLNIKDQDHIHKLSNYIEYDKRSRKKIYGIAYQVKIINDRAYLSYGPLGLKVLDVTDPTMPYVLGTYYRHEDVNAVEIYKNFALLGYIDMGLEIVDFSNLNNIRMVSRKNVRGYTLKDIQVLPPYVVISAGARGLRIFKFDDPFTAFRQAEFPKDYLVDNQANTIVIKNKVGYLANDFKGLTVLNMGLPLYPLQLNSIKTGGKATDLILEGDYLYVAGGKYIEVFDINEPEKPQKIFEHVDKDKEFVSLKMHNNQLFALYRSGNKGYGFVIFQVE